MVTLTGRGENPRNIHVWWRPKIILSLAILLVTLLGWWVYVTRNQRKKSDLQIGDEKVTAWITWGLFWKFCWWCSMSLPCFIVWGDATSPPFDEKKHPGWFVLTCGSWWDVSNFCWGGIGIPSLSSWESKGPPPMLPPPQEIRPY